MKPPTACVDCGRDAEPGTTRCPEHRLSRGGGRERERNRLQAFARDAYTCQDCSASLSYETAEADHIVPVALGGSNDVGNLRTLCHDCHTKRTTSQRPSRSGRRRRGGGRT